MRRFLPLLLASLVAHPPPTTGQQVVLDAEGYLTPPKVIADVVLADWGRRFRPLLLALATLAKPYVNLAEVAIDFGANRSRRLTIDTTRGYEIFAPETGRRTVLEVVRGMTVSGGRWSPDGKLVAFMGHGKSASHI